MARNGRRRNVEDFNGRLRQVIDPAVAKALSHPLRSHILVTLDERIASPNEIAKELGLAARDLDYHVKVLLEVGMIRLARTEKRRGVKEHFYEPNAKVLYFDDQQWRRLPEPVRASFSATLLRAVVEEAGEALRAGTFHARHDIHESRVSLLVDEQGWQETAKAMNEAVERVLTIRSESAQRLKVGSEPAIPASVFMLGFETAAGVGQHALRQTRR